MTDPKTMGLWQASGVIWQATHRHKKGGLYRVLGQGVNESDRVPVVIYDDESGQIWVRPSEEFWDGRFTAFPEKKPNITGLWTRLRAAFR